MGFRTVVIKNRAKLETRLNYLVVRGEQENKVLIDEINTLIIQTTAVSLTAALLNELIKNNIKVIFCDEKHNPHSELVAYYGAHNTPKKYKEQIAWNKSIKQKVWREIIKYKILSQAAHLFELGFVPQSEMLNDYASQVTDGDLTNREGHAAKVYFNCLLGPNNSRQGDGFINGCLNYGYAIILSAFNREIVSSGYLTQLGIWHDNEFNEFNLACDLMEPFRCVIDRTSMSLNEDDKDYKIRLINVLNYKTIIDGKHTTLDLAIRQFARSAFNALSENDENLLVFPEKILQDEF